MLLLSYNSLDFTLVTEKLNKIGRTLMGFQAYRVQFILSSTVSGLYLFNPTVARAIWKLDTFHFHKNYF